VHVALSLLNAVIISNVYFIKWLVVTCNYCLIQLNISETNYWIMSTVLYIHYTSNMFTQDLLSLLSRDIFEKAKFSQ
jgi:hypothetical protein